MPVWILPDFGATQLLAYFGNCLHLMAVSINKMGKMTLCLDKFRHNLFGFKIRVYIYIRLPFRAFNIPAPE
jgi:hypothetical protein